MSEARGAPSSPDPAPAGPRRPRRHAEYGFGDAVTCSAGGAGDRRPGRGGLPRRTLLAELGVSVLSHVIRRAGPAQSDVRPAPPTWARSTSRPCAASTTPGQAMVAEIETAAKEVTRWAASSGLGYGVPVGQAATSTGTASSARCCPRPVTSRPWGRRIGDGFGVSAAARGPTTRSSGTPARTGATAAGPPSRGAPRAG
jgi:hypothetical protein